MPRKQAAVTISDNIKENAEESPSRAKKTEPQQETPQEKLGVAKQTEVKPLSVSLGNVVDLSAWRAQNHGAKKKSK